MNAKTTAQLLLSTLVLSSVVTQASMVQARPVSQPFSQVTTFKCATQGRNFVTIAQRGNRTTPPIIVWKTNEFGREFTPAQRCQAVSQRLTQAVAQNGGRLTNLMLTTGSVNRQPVVCYVNGANVCNSRNVLFTLDRKNAQNPGEVLTRLLNFGSNGSGDPVVSVAGPQASSPYIRLEDVVNQAFESNNGGQPVPIDPNDRGI